MDGVSQRHRYFPIGRTKDGVYTDKKETEAEITSVYHVPGSRGRKAQVVKRQRPY